MKPLQVREGNEVTTAVGRIIDKTMIVNIEDTVLDEKKYGKGGFIDLPTTVYDLYQRQIDQVYFPGFTSQTMGRLVMLNPMAMSANLLLRIIAEFEAEQCDLRTLTKMVTAYQTMAVKLLSGKSGVIGSHVLANRITESGRAVLLINADYSPEFAGIPDRIMDGLKIRVGDPVIVGRDPAIWDGSIEILRAKYSGSNCVELHPLLFKQYGSDCDGDCMFIWKLPDDPDVKQEAEAGVLSFATQYAAWPTCLKTPQKMDTAVDWGNVFEETLNRSEVTGFSVSPREILDQGQRLTDLCKIMDKDVAQECKEIAEGLTPDQVREHLLVQNLTQLEMKIKLGPIGAASNRLKVLAGNNRSLQRSACYVSERLQQMLLSSKHVVGAVKKQAYSVDDVLTILNRKNQWKKARLATVLDELEKMGMDRNQTQPIIAYLWIGYPMSKAISLILKPYGEKGQHIARRMHDYVNAFCFDLSLEQVLKRFEGYASALPKKLDRHDLYEVFQGCTDGLSMLCRTFFPVHEIASGNKATIDHVQLCARVALNGETDDVGIGAMAMEMAREAY